MTDHFTQPFEWSHSLAPRAGRRRPSPIREFLELTEGIIFVPGAPFFAGGGARHRRLNYTRSDEATIDDGIGRLGASITRHIAAGAGAAAHPVPVMGGVSP